MPADNLHDPEQELEIVLFFISASFSVFRGQTLLSNLFGSGFARLGSSGAAVGFGSGGEDGVRYVFSFSGFFSGVLAHKPTLFFLASASSARSFSAYTVAFYFLIVASSSALRA